MLQREQVIFWYETEYYIFRFLCIYNNRLHETSYFTPKHDKTHFTISNNLTLFFSFNLNKKKNNTNLFLRYWILIRIVYRRTLSYSKIFALLIFHEINREIGRLIFSPNVRHYLILIIHAPLFYKTMPKILLAV